MSAQSTTQAKPNRAVRLTFRLDGSQLLLTSQQAMTKVAPASDATEGYDGHSGSWLEISDRSGNVVYRRVLHHPIQHDVEVPSSAPGQPFKRHLLDTPQADFDVLVPEYDGPVTVSIYQSTHRAGAPSGPSEELARFDLAPQEG
jgi:hypothetical protein